MYMETRPLYDVYKTGLKLLLGFDFESPISKSARNKVAANTKCVEWFTLYFLQGERFAATLEHSNVDLREGAVAKQTLSNQLDSLGLMRVYLILKEPNPSRHDGWRTDKGREYAETSGS